MTPRPGRYEIDTSWSAVTFRTRHLFGLAPVRGSFAIRAGTIDVAEPLAGSSAYVQIDPASFRTGNEQRDSNVRSERLLDAGRYPIITFRSEGVDGPASAGTLTVRNVTMPVTLSIEQTAVTPGSFNAKARTRIDRTESQMIVKRRMSSSALLGKPHCLERPVSPCFAPKTYMSLVLPKFDRKGPVAFTRHG